MEGLTKEDCLRILELYRNWNHAQKGMNEYEEGLLVSRRRLIKAATERLISLCKRGE